MLDNHVMLRKEPIRDQRVQLKKVVEPSQSKNQAQQVRQCDIRYWWLFSLKQAC